MPPTVITATQMQLKSGQIIKRAYREGEHFIVERDGFPVIAIIPIQDYEAWQAHRPKAPDAPKNI